MFLLSHNEPQRPGDSAIDRRVGDHSELSIIQLIRDERGPGSLTRPTKTARKKRTDSRYAAAVKAARAGGGKAPEVSKPAEPAEPTEPAENAAQDEEAPADS